MTKPVIKLPDSKGGWFSLLLGISLLFAAAAHGVSGDYEQASLDLAGAFGTLGLPAIFGKGYHVEVRRDQVVDTTPPPAFTGMPKLSESNQYPDPIERPKRIKPSSEVRRGDEL